MPTLVPAVHWALSQISLIQQREDGFWTLINEYQQSKMSHECPPTKSYRAGSAGNCASAALVCRLRCQSPTHYKLSTDAKSAGLGCSGHSAPAVQLQTTSDVRIIWHRHSQICWKLFFRELTLYSEMTLLFPCSPLRVNSVCLPALLQGTWMWCASQSMGYQLDVSMGKVNVVLKYIKRVTPTLI